METLDHFEEQPTRKEGIFVMPKVPASITLQGRNIPLPPHHRPPPCTRGPLPMSSAHPGAPPSNGLGHRFCTVCRSFTLYLHSSTASCGIHSVLQGHGRFSFATITADGSC